MILSSPHMVSCVSMELDCNDSLSLPSSYFANICLSCSRVINQFSTRIVYLIAPNQQSVHFDYF